MPPRYLDCTHEELTRGDGLAYTFDLYCACGHRAEMGPDDFARLPGLSLYQVVARLKCSACGAKGNIPEVRVRPLHTGGVR